jgi:hypothetical protein
MNRFASPSAIHLHAIKDDQHAGILKSLGLLMVNLAVM